MLKPELQQKIDNAFTYHAPRDDQPQKYQTLRAQAKIMATLIAETCPECDETLVALQFLQTAIMWANAAIAFHG